MKRFWVLGFLFFTCVQEEIVDACADTVILNDPSCQTFIDVTTPCIILEVLTTINGNQIEKYVYFHDGLNYSRIEVYFRSKPQDDYPVLPVETVTMSYEEDKIKEVVIQRSVNLDIQSRYSFDYKELEVTVLFELFEDGEITFTNSNNQLFVTNPKDSVYLSEGYFDILREYRNGNNTRFAVEAVDGMCFINNQRWQFTSKMSHDANPNVFRDYAVRYPLGRGEGYATQFWFGNNRNNMIAAVDISKGNDEDWYCYTFLRNGGQIWIKKYEFATDISYEYSYKYSCE
ncbi:MAG: hypothetical protein JNL53_06105 [Cyclobacteriaceae bacterium]|nr:hypothetical protein [Cyclobacteriaceae bacterium]